jgi:hypothetical protein
LARKAATVPSGTAKALTAGMLMMGVLVVTAPPSPGLPAWGRIPLPAKAALSPSSLSCSRKILVRGGLLALALISPLFPACRMRVATTKLKFALCLWGIATRIPCTVPSATALPTAARSSGLTSTRSLESALARRQTRVPRDCPTPTTTPTMTATFRRKGIVPVRALLST